MEIAKIQHDDESMYHFQTSVVEVLKALGAAVIGEPPAQSTCVAQLCVGCVIMGRREVVTVVGAPHHFD